MALSKKRFAKKPKKDGERPVWKSVLKWTAIGILARETYLALQPRRQRRRDMFNRAKFRQSETGKPLMVVGDPESGFVNRVIGRDYDCGDLCVDVRGCLQCPGYEQGRLEDVLPRLADNSYVIFVTKTLESVDDMETVARELARVSGGDVYAATTEPWTLTSLFWPGARRQFYQAPDGGPDSRFRWKPLPWNPKKATTTDISVR